MEEKKEVNQELETKEEQKTEVVVNAKKPGIFSRAKTFVYNHRGLFGGIAGLIGGAVVGSLLNRGSDDDYDDNQTEDSDIGD